MRFVTFALLGMLAWIQSELWFGKGGLPHVMVLREDVAQAKARNDEAQARNERLVAEVRDLQEGLEMVEEKARFELGMVRPDEIYVHIDPRIAVPVSDQP